MTHEQLIHDFESDAIPNDSFHHADHIRLAFAYLCEYPVLQALQNFSSALNKFATARGMTQLYNETITYAYFFLIRERMVRAEGASWEEFAFLNPDLFSGKNEILKRYYLDSTMRSDIARTVFIFPDKFE